MFIGNGTFGPKDATKILLSLLTLLKCFKYMKLGKVQALLVLTTWGPVSVDNGKAFNKEIQIQIKGERRKKVEKQSMLFLLFPLW